MIAILYLAIVLLSLLVLHVTIRGSKVARLIDKIPGPTGLPIIGNLLMFNVPIERLWDVAIKLLDDYNPRARVWSMNINLIFTCSAEDIKTLLSCKKNIYKNIVYNRLRVRGIDIDGLFTNNGETWRRRRKLIEPSFNPNLMKVYTKIINEQTKRLVANIENQSARSASVMDVVQVGRKLALGIICEAAMGVDPNEYGVEEGDKFQSSFDEITDLVFYRVSKPYITDWMYRIMELLNMVRKQESIAEPFRSFIDKIINARREYHEKIGYRRLRNLVDDVEDQNNTGRGTKRLSFLDLLLSAETEGLIDEEGIKGEVKSFMIAGYETAGALAANLLMLLAENKEVQDLAREEVTQLLERTGGTLEIADLNRLDYVDRCIKEALRLYPSAPIITRHITEDIKFENYEIPRGTEVMMHLYQLHRNPKYWPDPEKFDPDRFLPENVKNHYPFAYQPFSAGPRACIGGKFAVLELKIIFARLLSNFYLEPVDCLANMRLKTHVVLRPQTPCRVRFIRIGQKSKA